MAKFINDFTNYNVNQKELEKYNVNYITKDFKYKQADIVYKIQGKEIFYLIEHQTKVDYTMPYRMLNYCIEIIRNVVENKEINRSTYRYPIVIPIVLYTGDKKWTASTTFAESQIIENGFVEKTIDIKYKLIDINKIEIKDLLKEKTMLANALILEKCKNNDDVIKCLRIMIENQKDKAELKKLKRLE